MVVTISTTTTITTSMTKRMEAVGNMAKRKAMHISIFVQGNGPKSNEEQMLVSKKQKATSAEEYMHQKQTKRTPLSFDEAINAHTYGEMTNGHSEDDGKLNGNGYQYFSDEYDVSEYGVSSSRRPMFEFVPVNHDNDSLLVDSCDFICSDCNSFKRINYVLYKYNEWLMTVNSDAAHTVGFYDMLMQHQYTNSALLDDYHHLIYYHEFDQIYSNLKLKCCEESAKQVVYCKCLQRNHRDRLQQTKESQKTQVLYFDMRQPEQMNVEQLMDAIHCYFMHSYHLGLILTQQEFVYIHSNLMQEEEEKEEEKAAVEDDASTENNDFMKGNTNRIQNIQRIVNRKRKKIEYLRGKQRFLKHNKFVTQISQNIVEIGKHIGIEYEYYDQNKAFYVKPIHHSLREEMLNLVPIHEWNVLQIRAGNMKSKTYSKLLMADNVENGCGIQESSSMYIEHLLALMIYCNFDRIQTQFASTCIYIKPDEVEEDEESEADNQQLRDRKLMFDLLKQHRKFHHFGKRLFESVAVFGSTTNSSEIFYHAISHQTDRNYVYFTSPINCMSLPLSTSSKIEVLLNYSGRFKENGIILQLKQNGVYSMMKYFDCEWLSDFGGEAELFFYQSNFMNNHSFNINSVIAIKSTIRNHQNDLHVEYGEDYRDYIICLNILDKIFSAGYYFGINDLQNTKILDKTVDLLMSELHYDVLDHVDHENIPVYVLNLVHLSCVSKKAIRINWPDIIHYYSFIQAFLCYKDFLNLRVLMPIFAKCRSISIHGGSPSVLQLNQSKMDYIYSYLFEKRKQIKLKQIEIVSISKKSPLSFASCVQHYEQRFNNINWRVFIQSPVGGAAAAQSLIIQRQ